MFLVNDHASKTPSKKKISMVKKIFSKILHSFSIFIIIFLSFETVASARSTTLTGAKTIKKADFDGDGSGATDDTDEYTINRGVATKFDVEDDENFDIVSILISGGGSGISAVTIEADSVALARDLKVTGTITSAVAGAHTFAVDSFLTLAAASVETTGTLTFNVASSVGVVFAGTGDSVVMAGKFSGAGDLTLTNSREFTGVVDTTGEIAVASGKVITIPLGFCETALLIILAISTISNVAGAV